MPEGKFVTVVIPALNEEEAIAHVVGAIPRAFVDEIVVVDNGSTDATASRARAAGARVVDEPGRGYGRACAAGVRALAPACEIVVFLDGDGSDAPEMLEALVAPIREGRADFAIGSRVRGEREAGSMSVHQLIAGRLAGAVLRAAYGARYTDMCPFRAMSRRYLDELGMREMTYGWNVEMQARAAAAGLRIIEIPVRHRRRIGGVSKVSGTVRGTLAATARILLVLARVTLGAHTLRAQTRRARALRSA